MDFHKKSQNFFLLPLYPRYASFQDSLSSKKSIRLWQHLPLRRRTILPGGLLSYRMNFRLRRAAPGSIFPFRRMAILPEGFTL